MSDMDENTEAQDQLGPDELVTWATGLLSEAKKAQATWRKNAEEDYAFFAGDQWDDDDMAILEDQGRPPVVFNRIARTVNAVSGTEIQNRQEVRYIPREQGDVGVNDVQTQAAQWVRDNCDAEDEESEAFKDLLICGVGCTVHRLEHEVDPDGMIMNERVDPMEIFWDASAKKRNLIDRRWCAQIRKVSRDEFRQEWPGKEVEAGGEEWLKTEDEPHDASPPFYNDDDETANQPKEIEIIEFQYYEIEHYARVQIGQQVKEFPIERYQAIKPYLDQQGIRSVVQKRRVYKKLFIQGDQLLESAPLESQKDFTIQIMTGQRDRNRNLWFGLVRMMIDPQRFANKFFSQIIHIINTSAKSGVYLETGAVDNIRKFEDEFAQTGSISWLAPGALGNNMLKEKNSSNFPAGLDKLLQYSVESINDIPGVNTELMGLADYSGQSGVLEHQRKQAGISLLAVFFDSLRRYRKTSGRLLAELIREFIPEGTLIRVVDQQGQQYIPLTKDAMSMKFDVIVDDSPTSPNMKEKTFGILQSLLPQLMQAGIPVPPDVLDYAPLPEALIQSWKKMLIPDPQKQAEEEAERKRQQQIMDEAMGAETYKDKTQAQYNQARAAKTAVEAGTELFDGQKTQAETNYIQSKSKNERTDNLIKQIYPLK
jgi:hypothetical protein